MPRCPQSRSMAALRSGNFYCTYRSSGCTPFRAATRSVCRHPAATAAFKASTIDAVLLYLRQLLSGACSAGKQGCDAALEQPIKVVGMGSCGVDYLATVAKYPRPDEKLRSETLEVSHW